MVTGLEVSLQESVEVYLGSADRSLICVIGWLDDLSLLWATLRLDSRRSSSRPSISTSMLGVPGLSSMLMLLLLLVDPSSSDLYGSTLRSSNLQTCTRFGRLKVNFLPLDRGW